MKFVYEYIERYKIKKINVLFWAIIYTLLSIPAIAYSFSGIIPVVLVGVLGGLLVAGGFFYLAHKVRTGKAVQ